MSRKKPRKPPPPPRRTSRTTGVLFPALLLVLVAAVFANTLSGEFVFDDHILIENNPRIHSLRFAPQTFTTDFHEFSTGETRQSSFYRPLTQLSYMVDATLWGPDPGAFHRTNLLLQVVAAWLGFLLVRRLTGRPEVALVVAAIWAVHPVASESVAWISGRTDVLAAVFVLATLLLVVRYLETGRNRFLAGALLAAYLGCLSKEIGVVIPGLVLLADRAVRPLRGWRAASTTAAWFLVPVGVFLVQRTLVLEGLTTAGFPGGSRMEGVRTFFRALVYYVDVLFRPRDPVGDVHVAPPPAGDLLVVLGGVLAAGLLGLTGFLLWKRPRAGFPLGWGVLILAPAAGILIPVPTPVAVRYLYLPMFGIALALVWLFRSRAGSRVFWAGAAVAVLAAAFLTVARNREYRDDRSFYSGVLRHAERAGPWIEPGYFTLLNYGRILAEDGELARAERLLRRAVGQEPAYPLAWNNLGNVMGMAGRFEDAVAAWTRAAALDPGNPDPELNLAVTQERLGRIPEAIAAYRRYLELAPQSGRAPEIRDRIRGLGGGDSDSLPGRTGPGTSPE